MPTICHRAVLTAALLLCNGLIVPRLAVLADETEAAKSEEQSTVTVVVEAEGDETTADSDQPLEVIVGLDEVKPGKYWIGVMCTPLEDELVKAQLDLEQGLVVDQVVPDSPAGKAGLQAKDILIQVGDQPLGEIQTLVKATEEAQTNPLSLTIVRKAQRQQIQVTPAERPKKFSVARVELDTEAVDELKMLKESLRDLALVPKLSPKEGEDAAADNGSEKGASEQDQVRMLFLMPGMVLPEEAPDVPKDLEVTITKKGSETAKVVVKRGDQQWDVDADSLDKLPEDIRPHVQRMLGRNRQFSVGNGQFSWSGSFGKPLTLPPMIKQHLLISPGEVPRLFEFVPDMQLEPRNKLRDKLKRSERQIDKAKSEISEEAVEKIEQELKLLREQLEQLRGQREPDASTGEKVEEKVQEQSHDETVPDQEPSHP